MKYVNLAMVTHAGLAAAVADLCFGVCTCRDFLCATFRTCYVALALWPYGRGELKSWGFTPHPTKEDCSSYPPWILQDAPTELKAPWAFSVLMLSRQTLVPDSTDAISASMPRSRNEHKYPAATPRGG